jgi:hypothetical protein
MHIARRTQQELVIVAGTRWVSAICAALAFFILYFAITRHAPQGLLLAALLLLFALVMDLRKTFTFDATQRTVRWNGRKIFKAESGKIPFDEITDIGTEERGSFSGAAGRSVPIYRLTIVTSRCTIPMAYAFNGRPDHYSTLREQILEFVRTSSGSRSADPELSRQNRK